MKPFDCPNSIFKSCWGCGSSSLVFVVCCASSGFCVVLITHSEGSYQMCVCLCLVVCDLAASTMRHARHKLDICTTKKCINCLISVEKLDSILRLISFTNFNAQVIYSLTTRMLHYNPRHVSSINMPIFRRTNCIITASGIITLCKWLFSMPDESRLFCILLSSGILYSCLQRVTIPDAVIIQFVLLKMGMLMLETCWGL